MQFSIVLFVAFIGALVSAAPGADMEKARAAQVYSLFFGFAMCRNSKYSPFASRIVSLYFSLTIALPIIHWHATALDLSHFAAMA